MEITQRKDNNKGLYKTECKGRLNGRKIVTEKARLIIIISFTVKNVPIKSSKILQPSRFQFKIPTASKTTHLNPKPT